jgi:hypothetical protein
MFRTLIFSISLIMLLSITSIVQAETFILNPTQDGHVCNDTQYGPSSTYSTNAIHVRSVSTRRRVGYIMYDISAIKAGGKVFSNVRLSILGYDPGSIAVYGVIETLDNAFAGLQFTALTWNTVPAGVPNNPAPTLDSPVQLDLADLTGPLLTFQAPARGVRQSTDNSQTLADFLNADTDGIIVLLLAPAAEGQNGIIRSIRYTDGGARLEGEVGGLPRTALEPNPADQATEVAPDVILSWKPGQYASKHNVYFGTTSADVNAATTTNHPNVQISLNQDANTYDPYGLLTFGLTYYWRVDEVNAPPTLTVFTGPIWSFTVETPAYRITGTINATASSYMTGMEPAKTIDGSGINTANDQHGTDATTMWLSDTTPQPTWIKYQFDKIYKLHEMWVWNSNQNVESSFGLGIKSVKVEYSTDGANWTQLTGVSEFNQAPGAATYVHNTTVNFGGVAAKYVRITALSNWKGLVQQYGLSEVRFFYIPTQAREPNPTNGQTGAVLNPVLRWRAGREAVQHKLYFSTKMQDVNDGTVTPINIPAGSSYASYGPLSLDLGRTYYWKVNEVNNTAATTTWPGDVWSFSTAGFLVVDNFEDYNNSSPKRVFQTWLDGVGYSADEYFPVAYNGNGSGASVGHDIWTPGTTYTNIMETTIRHGDLQSVPLYYNNTNSPYYSETKRIWTTPQNWNQGGGKILTLYFYGDPNNNINEPMWVRLTDQNGNNKKVTYGKYTDEDVSSLATATWREWNISLADFTGVNPAQIKEIAIGIGDPAGTSPKTSGKVYLDDIRLYPPRCFVSRAKPAGDINNDCSVDYLDVDILGNDWLYSDVPETAWSGTFSNQDIGTNTVAGSYTFSGNVYTIQADGADIWAASDAFHYVYRQMSGDFQATIRVLSLQATNDNAKAGIMVRQALDPNSPNVLIAAAPVASAWTNAGATFQWRATQNGTSSSSRTLTGPSLPMCIRLVRRGNTFTSYIFLNGRWQQDGTATTVTMTDPVYVGLAVTSHVAGTLTTAKFDRACTFSGAELRQDGTINFKDYAAFAATWLEEKLWP